jgi:hypothetical protein
MSTINPHTQEIATITADELRQILFHISDQEMTVKELRRLLFDCPKSGAEIAVGHGMFAKMGVE